MKIVGIQGGKGSYHEAAAIQMQKDNKIKYFDTFSEVFKALRANKIDTAILAIANNRVQFIPETYEELTTPGHDLCIVGETYLHVEHALLSITGASLQSITEVHSQAPAIEQCLHFIENYLPHARIVEEHDTAGSAQSVAAWNDISKAAIASIKAGKLNGLTAIKTAIQDDPANITRFLEISLAKNSKVPGANKTSMLLTTPQATGALVNALLPFRDHAINLSSLQSKLIPNTPFNMMFFVEFEAGTEEHRTQKTLEQLIDSGYGIDILGSYKKAKIPLYSK
jgi:prephenate dehydratase